MKDSGRFHLETCIPRLTPHSPALSFMSHPAKALGIDFGGTGIKSAVVQNGQIISRGETVDTLQHMAGGSLLEAIFAMIAAHRAAHPEICSVGMGLPGFIDGSSGVVHGMANVPGWDNLPFLQMLRDRTGLPAAIENDANAMAYGEFVYGAAKGGRNVICITLGTGVGGALIFDGKLYRGSQYAAGEMGHASIDYRGPLGVYQTPGDLEQYVGNKTIARRASEAYQAKGRNLSPEECTPADLAKFAHEGDPIALAMWDSVGTEIGAALVNAIWLLNPDSIVIGGGVAKAGDLVFEPIRRTVNGRTSKLFHEQLRIVPAALGNDAGILGNARLGLEAAGIIEE